MKYLTLLLFLLACTLPVQPPGPETTVGTYREALIAVPAGSDTTFFLNVSSDTFRNRLPYTSVQAHTWASRHGYVIEW